MIIIYRYIMKELGLTFFVSLVGLNLILMMEKVLRLSRLFSGIGVSYSDIIKLILLIQPQILIFTIPMAYLLSVLLSYGGLEFNNELIALRSSGMRFRESMRPAFYFSTALFITSFFISIYIIPFSSRIMKSEINRILSERALLSIEPGVFFSYFKDISLLVNEKKGADTFHGIFIYDGRDAKLERIITAREGMLSFGENIPPFFRLTDGVIHTVNKGDSTEIHFQEYIFSIYLKKELLMGKERGMMSISELYKNASSEKNLNYFVELHRRLSFPALIIVLAFLAPSLSLMAGRAGRLGGFVIGLIVFTLYYATLTYFEKLVISSKISHFSSWIPFVILTFTAIFLYRRKE